MGKVKRDGFIEKRDLILNGSVWKVLLLICLPIAFTNFIQMFYSIVDTFFAGKMGVAAIAGITSSNYVINFIRSLGMGVCIAGTTLIAKDIGAGKQENAKNIMVQLFFILCLISLVLSIAVIPFSRDILFLLGSTSEIIEYSDTYFKLSTLSLIPLFLSQAHIAVKKATGGVKEILISNITSLIIKVIACYFLVEVMGYGVWGLVISTVLARSSMCVFAFYDLIIKKSELQLKLANFTIVKGVIITILIIGLPLGLERSANSLGNILLNRISMTFGYEFVAARGVVTRVISLGQSILTGFAVGVAPIISQNIGAGNYIRVREIILKASLIATTMSVLVYTFLRVNGRAIASVFLREDSEIVSTYITDGFYIFGFAVLGWSLYQVGMGVFKGFGHTKSNMSISIIRLFGIRIPLVYILVAYSSLNEKSIWIGMLASNGISMVVLWWLVYTRYFKENRMKAYFLSENQR